MRTRALALAGILASSIAMPAVADDRQQCLDANKAFQDLRDAGKYREARGQLVICERATCPTVVRRDCMQWHADLEQVQPTLVLSATDGNGADLTSVRVGIDGAPLAESIDGKPVAVDPGAHVLTFEAPNLPVAELRIVVKSGEKHRLVSARLGSAPAARATPPVAPPQGAPPSVPAPPAAEPRPVPPAAYVATGVGVLALGSFTYFGLRGSADASRLNDDPCAVTSTCPASDIHDAKMKLLAADISLAVAVVAAGVATWLFIARPSSSAAASRSSLLLRGPRAATH